MQEERIRSNASNGKSPRAQWSLWMVWDKQVGLQELSTIFLYHQQTTFPFFYTKPKVNTSIIFRSSICDLHWLTANNCQSLLTFSPADIIDFTDFIVFLICWCSLSDSGYSHPIQNATHPFGSFRFFLLSKPEWQLIINLVSLFIKNNWFSSKRDF